MATVTGIISGTGQEVEITIPTARVPELGELVDPVEDDDEIPIYDASANKTRWKAASGVRAYFGSGGSGAGVPPVLQGGDMEIVVDDTNIDGTQRVLVPELLNATFTLERVGYGQLLTSQFTILPSGGFDLVDDTVRLGDVYFAHVYSAVPTAPGGGTVTTSIINGITLITDDITLNATHANKLLHLSSPTKNITVTLLDIADAPDNSIVCLETTINNGYFSKIQTQSGQLMYVGGSGITSLWLGSNEFLWLLRGADGWYVMKISDGVFNAGQPFFDYAERMNSIVGKGQLVANTAAPRIVDFLAVNPDAVISESLWQSDLLNRGKFTIYDANTLRFPDLQNRVFRGLNNIGSSDTERPGNTVGLLQDDKLGPHDHNDISGDTASHGSSSTALSGVWKWLVGLTDTGNGKASNSKTGNTGTNIGTETRMKNAGFLPLIKI